MFKGMGDTEVGTIYFNDPYRQTAVDRSPRLQSYQVLHLQIEKSLLESEVSSFASVSDLCVWMDLSIQECENGR
jgi:hypothetical protein